MLEPEVKDRDGKNGSGPWDDVQNYRVVRSRFFVAGELIGKARSNVCGLR